MKLIYKIATHAGLLMSLALFATLSKNQYAWMNELDPSIVQTPVDGNEQIKVTVTLLILVLAIAGQIIIIRASDHRIEKAFSIFLIAIAISVWLLRFS